MKLYIKNFNQPHTIKPPLSIMSDKIIYCLFSIRNDYGQPENNLMAWWSAMPSVEDVLYAFNQSIHQGDAEKLISERYYNDSGICEYRIEQVKEGQKLKS